MSKVNGTTPTRFLDRAILIAFALSLVGNPVLAEAEPCNRRQNGCIAPGTDPARKPGKPLYQPYEISTRGSVLSTALEAKYFTDVKLWDCETEKDNKCEGGEYKRVTMSGLRMYGYQNPKDGSRYACPSKFEYCYNLPGPLFRIRKGDEFKLNLRNNLVGAPVAEDDGTGCNVDNQPSKEGLEPEDVFPNCFHGNNVTNFHFHGFHISPQPPHDNIFLMLDPGEQYDLTSGVIPTNQAEGTHWYHPHHHGATSLQVSNGMAGAFLVEGEFDDWLNGYYQDDLEEKVLIIQEIHDVVPFPGGFGTRVKLLINGQKEPVLQLDVGEVERWRFIDATSNNLSDLKVFFPGNVEVRQIAMDGIQFATSNYCAQPLVENASGNYCAENTGIKRAEISLAPGNRADFLVKGVGSRRSVGRVFGELDVPERPAEAIRQRFQISPGRSSLFTVKLGRKARKVAEEFPPEDEWPSLPEYLSNIETVIDPPTEVLYSMEGKQAATPIIQFKIDNRQFNKDCVDQRMALGTAEEWRFTNVWEDGGKPLQHPAHIHVNPFQVLRRDGVDHPTPDPIWQDTIALSKEEDKDEVVIRHRFDNFTGMFVMHCHFLGHEDRGMMQTIEIGDASQCNLCPGAATAACTEYRNGLARPPGIRELD